MNEIIPFVFNHDQQEAIIRVTSLAGDPWFVGADVGNALGVSNPAQALQRLKPQQKGIIRIDTPGGPQQMTIIDESGLYMLAMRSDKPRARAFQEWIAEEVIPSIRRTGKYELPAAAVASGQPELLSAINQVETRLAGFERAVDDRLGRIEGKFGGWREGFSKSAVRYACEGVAKYNNGECIFCNEAVVVTMYAEKLTNARVHHGNGNRADFRKENCVIPCAECHDRLTYANRLDHIAAYKALSIAETFHMKLSQKAARIYAPTMPTTKHWDMRAATQADMGFPVRRKHPA